MSTLNIRIYDPEMALAKLKDLMSKHAFALEPSTARAQCYNISNYKFIEGETIAERILRDHGHTSHAQRAASLIVDAGCAVEVKHKKPHLFGTFIFLDGSTL
jgi:uncharacterized protein (DUF1786 family)